MFLADAKLNGELDANGYKRLVRIVKAVINLEDSQKKKDLLNRLNDKLVDVYVTIDALGRLDGTNFTTVEDLGIRCKNPLQVLKGLGVATARYSRKQHHKIIVNKGQIEQLNLLAIELRAMTK